LSSRKYPFNGDNPLADFPNVDGVVAPERHKKPAAE